MGSKSFIYRNIHLYRALMNVLYLGKYGKRFDLIVASLRALTPGQRIAELCFGDTVIAEACKQAGHEWIGLDINREFVSEAKKKGYQALEIDLTANQNLPRADILIMMGSFYHFHRIEDQFLKKMLDSAPILFISEPVLNLSRRSDFLGAIARRAANAGKGDEEFRYTKDTFLEFLDRNSQPMNFTISMVEKVGKDLIVKITTNGEH